MAKYTIELYKIMELTQLFNFDYNLYDMDLKDEFEKYFIDYFYFNEIGFETIGRFKKALQNKLNTINGYYTEYYKTCKAMIERDMMLTKDVIEEFSREVTSNSDNTTSSNTTSNGTVSDSTTINSDSELKRKNENMYSQTPRGKIENVETYMTEGTVDYDTTTNSITSTESTQTNTNNSNIGETVSNTDNTLLEKTTFTSKGNLGVSSDGFLIEKWRELISDINYKICNEELSELFMLIY